jgi:phosphohistidine phosphatase
MLRLMLMRHAKSSWSDGKLADRDRPLNGRGRDAAKRMGEQMAAQGLKPDTILASPARRAQETLKLAGPALRAKRVETVEALYDFGDGEVLLDAIRRHGASSRALMLIGHNPALENLAASLSGSGDKSLREDLTHKYPTGALAVIDFKARSWPKIAPGAGKLTAFIKPRSLAQGH